MLVAKHSQSLENYNAILCMCVYCLIITLQGVCACISPEMMRQQIIISSKMNDYSCQAPTLQLDDSVLYSFPSPIHRNAPEALCACLQSQLRYTHCLEVVNYCTGSLVSWVLQERGEWRWKISTYQSTHQ